MKIQVERKSLSSKYKSKEKVDQNTSLEKKVYHQNTNLKKKLIKIQA